MMDFHAIIDYVIPELIKRNQKLALFFVPTGPLNSKKLLPVHRVQIVFTVI